MFLKGNEPSLIILFNFIALFALVFCSGGEMEQNKIIYTHLKDIPDSAWENLSKKKIYFGHQSIGNNIKLIGTMISYRKSQL
jgi:hypothetical protein